MASLQITAFLVAAVFLVLGGLIFNGFIATLIIIEWAKCQRLPSIELLLLSLGMSNIFTTVFLTGYFAIVFSLITVRYLVFQILRSCFIFAASCRYTFTAWLCVFYCVKIVNSTQSLFLWWKLRISRLIPRLIVGSLIFSLSISLIAFYSLQDQTQGTTASSVTNATQEETLTLESLKIIIFATATGCPIVLVLLSCTLVVASLYHHVCQMTGKESCLKNPQTEAHIKAAGTVVSLLLLYVLFYVGNILSLLDTLRESVHIFVSIMMLVYSPAQAAILMFVNPKLKQAASRMLLQTKH
ncbi:taste receptor type 2 member 40-like [Pogona vitticeps]